MTFPLSDLVAIAPQIGVLLVAIIVVMVELTVTRRDDVLQMIVIIGLMVVMGVTLATLGGNGGAFNGMIARDGMASFFNLLLTIVTLLAVLMSRDYLSGSRLRHGEYYALLLITSCGMMFLASATDLVTLFLGIETMSITLYVLAGSNPENTRSSEAALKYFLLGAFSTGFLLYGMALIYGGTGGNTNLREISIAIAGMGGSVPVHLYAGIALMMVGFLFKVAAVPFHFWSPDVYQGAPTPITAFMSAGPKAAAFAAFIRLFGGAFPELTAVWSPVMWIVAAVTMTLANFVALSQQNLKRMLAYSSIAHAGYLLIAVLAASHPEVRSDAMSGMMFYLTAYYLMNLGAFTVAIIVQRAQKDGDYQINDYKGLASQHPWVAAAMAIFLISLAGIPPTAGFFGKFVVFSAGVKAGLTTLVVIAVLNSVVSVFYYLRIVVYMYMRPSEATVKLKVTWAFNAVLILCLIGILKFGFMPGRLIDWTRAGADSVQMPKRQLNQSVVIDDFAVIEEVDEVVATNH